MKTVFIVSSGFLLLVNLYTAQTQILPQSFCSYFVNQFRFRGCLDKPTLYCRLLALKLKLKPFQRDVCTEYPCTGYGQSPNNFCTSGLTCPIPKIQPKGICPINQLCCST